MQSHEPQTSCQHVPVAGLIDGPARERQVRNATAMLTLRRRFHSAAQHAATAGPQHRKPTSRRPGEGRWPARMRLEDLALAEAS